MTYKSSKYSSCESWLWFVDPDGYRVVSHYVVPLLDQLLSYKNGEFRSDYPILKAALEHCDRIRDVMLLRIILFHFIAFESDVREWAMNLILTHDGRKCHILPWGCERECIFAIKNLCRQYASLKITGDRFDERVFFVVTTGCKSIGDLDWIVPANDPIVNREIYKYSQKTVTDEELLQDVMSTMSKRKCDRKIKGARRALFGEEAEEEDIEGGERKRKRRKIKKN
jgi:hypothetical protein